MNGFNTEEIIRMAQEAGWGFNNSRDSDFVKAQLKFAALVAAAEREACAKVCDERAAAHPMGSDEQCEAEDCAAAIRARGQQENG
jgi:hypothetical protein